MANRQIYELTTRTLAITDFFPSQNVSGSAEAGKATMDALKLLMQGGARKLVVRFSYNGSFSSTIRENDYAGLVITTFDNPSNGVITMQVSSSIFSTTKSVILANSINGAGVPYIVCPVVSAGDTITLNIFKYDGTQTSTPFFDNYIITIITYP